MPPTHALAAHTAVGGDDQPLGRNIFQRLADQVRNLIRALDLQRVMIDHADDDLLVLDYIANCMKFAGAGRACLKRQRIGVDLIERIEGRLVALDLLEDALLRWVTPARRMRAAAERRPFVILGASGAGKSSLLKAGIIPRLRREAPAWLPLRAFRPGADPMLNLAEALARTFGDFGADEALGDIRERLMGASKAERSDKGAPLKKIGAVRGTPTARLFSPEIAELLPGAGAAHSKDFRHDRSATLRLMFGMSISS